MENRYFKTQDMGKGVIRIEGPCQEFCFLVLGEKKAALIDTGSGFGDIRQLVSQFTSLPVQVLLTHGHMDHCGGVFFFEEAWLRGACLQAASCVGIPFVVANAVQALVFGLLHFSPTQMLFSCFL